jgi:hypothetical protein
MEEILKLKMVEEQQRRLIVKNGNCSITNELRQKLIKQLGIEDTELL